jgi:hypothetical protein
MNSIYELRIAQLENEILELRRQKAAELEEIKKSVTPQYEWTLTPTVDNYDKIYDSTCKFYTLDGRCVNKHEAEAAGHSHIQEGGMKYLFNTLSGRIVGSWSGGTVWISKGGTSFSADEYTLANLSAFIVQNPDGGNVTSIILDHRARNGK